MIDSLGKYLEIVLVFYFINFDFKFMKLLLLN